MENSANYIGEIAAPLPVLSGQPLSLDAKRALWLTLVGIVSPLIYGFAMTGLRELHMISVSADYLLSIAALPVGMALECGAFRLALRARSFGQARAALLFSALFFVLYGVFFYSNALETFANYELWAARNG